MNDKPENQSEEQSEADQSEKQIESVDNRSAGFWLRFLSAVLDGCIFIISLQLLSLLVDMQQVDQQSGFFAEIYAPIYDVFLRQGLGGLFGDPLKMLIFGIFWLLFSIVYNTIFECSGLNATPGKVVMGICVMGVNQKQPSPLQVLLRNVLKVFSALPLMTGFLMAAVSKNQQALHDLFSGCAVVRVYHSSKRRILVGTICVLFFVVCTNFAVQVSIEQNAARPEPKLLSQSKRVQQNDDDVREADLLRSQVLAGDKDFPFAGSLVRLMTENHLRFAVSSDGFPEAAAYAMEFLFFSEKLTEEEKRKLLSCPKAMENAELLIGKRPDAAVTLFYKRYTTHCSSQDSLLKTTVTLRRSGFDILAEVHDPFVQVSFQGISDNPAWALDIFCSELKPGGQASISLSGERPVSENFDKKLSWDFRLNEKIREFKTLGTFSYTKHAEAVALWDKRRGELQVAFFPDNLELYDLFNIREERGFSGLNRVKAEAVATFKLPRNVRRLMREHVSEGYRLDFFSSKDRLNLPTQKEKYSIEFKPGVQPLSLAGKLRDNERIIGRMQGKQVFTITEGIFEIRWRLGFNAKLLLPTDN